jgi:hypothetical protein
MLFGAFVTSVCPSLDVKSRSRTVACSANLNLRVGCSTSIGAHFFAGIGFFPFDFPSRRGSGYGFRFCGLAITGGGVADQSRGSGVRRASTVEAIERILDSDVASSAAREAYGVLHKLWRECKRQLLRAMR